MQVITFDKEFNIINSDPVIDVDHCLTFQENDPKQFMYCHFARSNSQP